MFSVDNTSQRYNYPGYPTSIVNESPQLRQAIQAQKIKQQREQARIQLRQTLRQQGSLYDGASASWDPVVYFSDYRISGTVEEIVDALRSSGINEVNVGELYLTSNGQNGCPPGIYPLSEEVIAACSFDSQPQYDGIQGFLSNPNVQSALYSGGGGALGSALGGTWGGAIGAGAGPIIQNLISPQKEPWKQTLTQAGVAALGGGFGSSIFHGPIGGGLGGAAGGYLGHQLAQKFDG